MRMISRLFLSPLSLSFFLSVSLAGKHSKFEIKISFLGAAPHSFKIKLLCGGLETSGYCNCCLELEWNIRMELQFNFGSN